MDPPSYGRGPGGEIWKLEENVHELLNMCMEVLSPKPIFMILNAYTTGLSPAVTSYLLGLTMGKNYGGRIISEEIGLPVTESGLELPCGSSAIWECK